ncbi:MAG: hypothetical protein JRE45_16730 [Deltaproteobacteria bacterium]|nr:hypothetical protein [Deltaproteobacteria bacterium]MBW2380561.1 hypothetical protein [Deltaproteobacteria bacterium]MBW2551988.1 hypothetical protein [Deltaproteobacteria bacterium]MBW2629248.1 hypothetical protein [Deltaproteobacteria bacterium]MBW2686398.1 hypothetical protein [Deltaproteobacteria bacterium]
MPLLRGWGVVGFVFAAALWLAPAEARAFPDEPYSLDEGKKAHTDRFHIMGELGMFAGKLEGDQRSIVMSPLLEMRFQLAYSVVMQAVWGMSYVNVDTEQGEPDNDFRFGNPYLAFHYQGKKGQFSYRVGLGVTVPVATLPGDIVERVTAASAYFLAAALRGNTMFWLWDPHTVSVIVPIAFERSKPSGFLWGAYLDTGALIKLNDKNARTSKTDFIMQMAAMMGYQATDWLRVGSRFSLVLIPKFNEQKTQLAVEPYLRFGRDRAFGAIRVNINIDNPNGFSFDSRQVWGLRIGGGASF